MKAILVIDMPDYVDFNKVKTVDVGLCFNVKEYTEPFIKSNVPLKPMPTKKKPLFDPNHCEIEEEIKIIHEIVGYNRCIDEIMGETKNETVKSAE